MVFQRFFGMIKVLHSTTCSTNNLLREGPFKASYEPEKHCWGGLAAIFGLRKYNAIWHHAYGSNNWHHLDKGAV